MMLTRKRKCTELPSRWHLIHPPQPCHRRDLLLAQARRTTTLVWQHPSPKCVNCHFHSPDGLTHSLAPQMASIRRFLGSVMGNSVPNFPAPSFPAECNRLGQSPRDDTTDS